MSPRYKIGPDLYSQCSGRADSPTSSDAGSGEPGLIPQGSGGAELPLWVKRMDPAPLKLPVSEAVKMDGSVAEVVRRLGGLEALDATTKKALRESFHGYKMECYRRDMVSVEESFPCSRVVKTNHS